MNWEIFGPQITFELIGQIEPDEYMAFGFSGSDNSSRMINSDVSISYLENHIGYTKDYNISGLFPVSSFNFKLFLLHDFSFLSVQIYWEIIKVFVPIQKLVE